MHISCACERVCSPYFPNDLSGCSEAISRLASQTADPLFSQHTYIHIHSHTVCLSEVAGPKRPTKQPSTRKRNYREVCLSPPPISPLLLLLLSSPSIRLPAALETRLNALCGLISSLQNKPYILGLVSAHRHTYTCAHTCGHMHSVFSAGGSSALLVRDGCVC